MNDLNQAAISSPSEIITERLCLRPITDDMKENVFIGHSDFEVRHWMKMPTLDTSEKKIKWWKKFATDRSEGKVVQWGCFDLQLGHYIGLMTTKDIDAYHRRAEIGYSILKPYWGKGYGREAVGAMVNYGWQQIGFHTLMATILPFNKGSQRIVEGLGFSREGYFPDAHYYENQFYDILQYSCINPSHKN